MCLFLWHRYQILFVLFASTVLKLPSCFRPSIYLETLGREAVWAQDTDCVRILCIVCMTRFVILNVYMYMYHIYRKCCLMLFGNTPTIFLLGLAKPLLKELFVALNLPMFLLNQNSRHSIFVVPKHCSLSFRSLVFLSYLPSLGRHKTRLSTVGGAGNFLKHWKDWKV